MNSELEDKILTTIDNPWNPFTHWDEWYQWDTDAGYHTCSLLARLTVTSDDLSEVDNSLAIDEAMNVVIDINPFGVHKILSSKEKFIPLENK